RAATVSRPEPEQPLQENILDQFVNSHEQTYEEFLGTFTYLAKALCQPCKHLFLTNLQIVMDEGWKVGCANQGDLPQARKVKVRFALILFKIGITSVSIFMHCYFPPLQPLWDEVQPFSLDEDFDYDNVALTPKFGEAVLDLSEQRKMGTDPETAGPKD
uniref:Intraflagellar transport associated protein n=1 Tax=Sphenodon punctatus TaxID=8508 RepID=A0A8D0HPE0_SPHPU